MRFALPVSPYSLNDSQLDQLRKELAAEERAAQSAPDWTWRTRHEENASSLRRQIASAELDRRLERQRHADHQRRDAENTRVANLARSVAAGRCLAPVTYFEPIARAVLSWKDIGELVPAAVKALQDAGAMPDLDHDYLEWLAAEATKLQVVVDDPSVQRIDRMKAQQRLDEIKKRIQAHEAATRRLTT